MEPDALLLLGEHILEPAPADGRPTDYLLDVQMMVMFGSAHANGKRVHEPAGRFRLRDATHYPDKIACFSC
jgi:hypothetical protein